MTTNLHTTEITLDNVLRHAVDGMFVIDRNRHVVLFSEGCERITGASRDSILGTSCACHEIIECQDEHGRALSGPLCPSEAVFNGEATSARQRMSIRHRDGRRLWVETTYSPMYDDGRAVVCVVGIMRDVTQATENELRRAAEGDMFPDVGGASTPAGGLAPEAEGGDYPQGAASGLGPLDQMLTAIERREILSALRRAKGQRTLAARMLGISRSRLYRRMEALGIDPRDIRSD